MPVEAKVICSDIQEVIRHLPSIKPGESAFIDPFDDAIVSAECERDDLCARAVVNPLLRNFIGAAIFTSSGELLRDADVKEPIYFGQGEMVVIYSSGCKEEVWLHHVTDSDLIRIKTIQRQAVSKRNIRRYKKSPEVKKPLISKPKAPVL